MLATRWRCPHFHRPGAHRAVDRNFCGDRRVRRAHYGRSEPVWIQGRHGADLNSQVSYRHRAPHRAGHECGGSISLVVDFVHVRSPKARTQRQPVSFCVSVAALKCSSVAAAIAVRSIVPTAVPDWRGARGNARPDGATKRATAAASSMRCVPVAIARGKRM